MLLTHQEGQWGRHSLNSPTPTPSLTSTVQCCSQQLRQNWCWQARESKFSFRTNCMHTAQWWEECTIAWGETKQQCRESIPDLPEHLQLILTHLHHPHCDNGLQGGPGQNRFMSSWGAKVLHCPKQSVLLRNLSSHRAQADTEECLPLLQCCPEPLFTFLILTLVLVWNMSLC